MGQKDITEKVLEDYNDVFADIINGLLFDGVQEIKPEALENTSVHAQYKAENDKVHELERDIAKYWKEEKVELAICGIENQSKVEKNMPFRIIGYDGATYRSQLQQERKKMLPVVTIVLYFGTDRHWNSRKKIKELMEIPRCLDMYVNDYQMHVFEVAWLTEEQISHFRSDFKVVANFFVQKRKNKDYIPDDPTEIRHVIMTVSHMGDKIIGHFGNGSNLGVSIQYYNEVTPLGNAGALFKLREQLGEEPFLLLNADAVFDVDFNRMVGFHQEHGGLVTLFTHPNNHPYDSGLIIADKDMSVQSWLAKEDVRPTYYKNRVNAGLHVIDPKILDMASIDVDKIGTVDEMTGKTVKVDLDRQLLKPLAGTGEMFCYDSPEYVKDMGTPDRFHQVEDDFNVGRVSAKNLSNKQKAVFLDRDGTINKYVGFLRNINDFELIDGVAEAIKKINASGYLAIVVTNQPVIARGEVAFQELEEIHNKMETELGLQGAYLDAIYYCPHHPHKGYEGEIPELKIECDCRKPKPGMLLKAAGDYNIDLSQSYMIGDGENDIKAGLAAGCKTVLINGEGTDAKNEDFGQVDTLSSVLEFVDKYLH